MTNYRFERAARLRRTTAWTVAILFHLLLLAAVAWYADGNLNQYLPETVQHWLGIDDQPAANLNVDVPRP